MKAALIQALVVLGLAVLNLSGCKTPVQGEATEMCPADIYLISVDIEESGAIAWNGTPITGEDFNRYLVEAKKRAPTAWFLITSNPLAKSDAVADVSKRIQGLGFQLATATCPPVIF